MPKASGEDLKTDRLGPTRPQPKAQAPKHFSTPGNAGGKLDPMAPGAPKIAADLKSNSNIDPRQMVY